MRKLKWLFGFILSFALLTGCGSNNKEAKELLQKILQVVGIPYNMVVNICQDGNGDGICNATEVTAKIYVTKDDTAQTIWKKFQLADNGQYILKHYDPKLKILMEIADDKGKFNTGKHVTLPFKPKPIIKDKPQELSILQSMVDNGFLQTQEYIDITQTPKARNIIDQILLENIFQNQAILEEYNLTALVATDKNLEFMADGLRELNVTELVKNLNNCEQNATQECRNIVIQTDDRTEINKEDAQIIKDTNSTKGTTHRGRDDNNATISDDDNTTTVEDTNTTTVDDTNTTEDTQDTQNNQKTEKQVADGYLIKLSSPAIASCANNSYSSSMDIGEKGKIVFEGVTLTDDCIITIPSGSTIDSNNNGVLDATDKTINFEMKASNDTSVISPLTTLLLELKGQIGTYITEEDYNSFKSMVKDFDPVLGSTSIASATGVEKLKLQKLIILAETIKTALNPHSQAGGIGGIVISNIIDTNSSEVITNFHMREGKCPIDGTPCFITSPAPPPVLSTFVRNKESIMKDIVNILEFLDPAKIDLNNFLVNISDNGKNIVEAINASHKIPITGDIFEFPIKSNADIPTVSNTLRSITDSINSVNKPIADAGYDKNVTYASIVTFDAGRSSDLDGDIVEYKWLEGTNILSNQATFTENNFSVGTHDINLTVTDKSGNTSSDMVTCVVRQEKPILTKPKSNLGTLLGGVEANETMTIKSTFMKSLNPPSGEEKGDGLIFPKLKLYDDDNIITIKNLINKAIVAKVAIYNAEDLNETLSFPIYLTGNDEFKFSIIDRMVSTEDNSYAKEIDTSFRTDNVAFVDNETVDIKSLDNISEIYIVVYGMAQSQSEDYNNSYTKLYQDYNRVLDLCRDSDGNISNNIQNGVPMTQWRRAYSEGAISGGIINLPSGVGAPNVDINCTKDINLTTQPVRDGNTPLLAPFVSPQNNSLSGSVEISSEEVLKLGLDSITFHSIGIDNFTAPNHMIVWTIGEATSMQDRRIINASPHSEYNLTGISDDNNTFQ